MIIELFFKNDYSIFDVLNKKLKNKEEIFFNYEVTDFIKKEKNNLNEEKFLFDFYDYIFNNNDLVYKHDSKDAIYYYYMINLGNFLEKDKMAKKLIKNIENYNFYKGEFLLHFDNNLEDFVNAIKSSPNNKNNFGLTTIFSYLVFVDNDKRYLYKNIFDAVFNCFDDKFIKKNINKFLSNTPYMDDLEKVNKILNLCNFKKEKMKSFITGIKKYNCFKSHLLFSVIRENNLNLLNLIKEHYTKNEINNCMITLISTNSNLSLKYFTLFKDQIDFNKIIKKTNKSGLRLEALSAYEEIENNLTRVKILKF